MRNNEVSFDKISFNLRILIITSNIDSELKETCKIWCDWWLNFRWSLFRKLFLEKRDSSFVFKIPRTIFLKMKKKKKKRKGNRSVEFLSFEDSMLVLESSTSSLLHLPYVHQFPSPLPFVVFSSGRGARVRRDCAVSATEFTDMENPFFREKKRTRSRGRGRHAA